MAAITALAACGDDSGRDSETSQSTITTATATATATINQHWGVSAMYLEGHALQKHGPQLTRVLFLNLNLTEIALSNSLRVHAFPSVYYLFTDGYRGTYGTVTGVLAHKKWPFSLQSTINQTFSSDLPDNKEFLWNVTLNYNFNKTYQTTKIRS